MEKESRRVQMTRRLLNDAMEQLLQEKTPEKITVTEICQIADVNRTTYYKYYSDPLQQFQAAQEQTIAGLTELIGTYDLKKLFRKKEMKVFVMAILDYVEDHLRIIQALDKYAALAFWTDLSYSIGKALLAMADQKTDPSEDLVEMGAYAFTGSYALIFRWVTWGEPKDKEVLADSIIHYTMAVLKSKYKIFPG